MHARRIQPETGHLDRRRLAGAVLSALLPGLGQLMNRRRRLATWFLVPTLILLLIVALLVATQSPARLVAWVADPTVLAVVLTLNLLVLAARVVAVVQAFLDTRWHGPSSRNGILALALIVGLVVLPHALAYRYGTALGDTFASVFEPTGGEEEAPPPLDARINVLLIGVDALPWRTATLTDTMMIVSLDPVGRTVSMVSLPRDLIDVPLGNGDVFGPKLNSLMSYADRHPDDFPQGGTQALLDAAGALLGIDIPYYARIDFYGFVEMVDTVGGIDLVVTDAIDDPGYLGHQRRRARLVDLGGTPPTRRGSMRWPTPAPARRLARATSRAPRDSNRSSWPCAMPSPVTARCCGSCRACSTRSAGACARTCPPGRCRSSRP